MRKIYLDQIRWITIMLVLVYHVCYLYNGLNIPGGIPGAVNIPVCDAAAGMIYPWFMVLLFVIAGMSAKYALQTRTEKQFIKERAEKLLIPSTLGLWMIHWMTGYWNIKMGGGLAYIPKYLIYPVSAISGIGPLWFIQMLFLFSCILLLFRKIDPAEKIWTLCQNTNVPMLLLLALFIFGAAQIGNMPVLTMYRFGIYFVSFFIGYYIFSHDKVQDRIEKVRIPMLVLAGIGAAFYAVRYLGKNYTSPSCLQSITTNFYLWAVVLAVLGCGKRYLNGQTAFTRYLSKASFGVYILHYPVLTTVCYTLHTCFELPAICNYMIALILEFAVTFAAYEMVKRIPVIRYFVLGQTTK